MKGFKRISIAIMAISILVLSVFGNSGDVKAADEDWTYEITDEGYAVITGYTGSAGNITIPATIGEYTVIGIDDRAFFWNTSLTSVIISNGIQSIGEEAFSCCSSLKSVTIPASVTVIDSEAFLSSFKLTDINYSGTCAEWNKIDSRIGGNEEYSIYLVIHCSDGNVLTLDTPKISGATVTYSGTKISWNEVTDAYGYAVLRRTANGSWAQIDTTTSTEYTDNDTLINGTTYYYTVCAYRGNVSTALANKYLSNYWSSYNTTGVKSVYLGKPTLSSAEATTSGTTKLTWGAVSGASGYAVLRCVRGDEDDGWSIIKMTTSTSYTDNDALESGTTYYYTVMVYVGSASVAKANPYKAEYWGCYNADYFENVYLKTPTLKKATAVSYGTKITWTAVNGASGYALYRKKAGGKWKILDYIMGTSYIDTSVLKSGATYYYSVRPYNGEDATENKFDAEYWGGYNTTGLKSVYLKTPKLKKAKMSGSAIKVSWKSVSKATGYAVLRKTVNGSWKLIGTTKSTSYKDKTAKAGKLYLYTVRAYKGSAKKAKANKYNAAYWGSYESDGAYAMRSTSKSTLGVKAVSYALQFVGNPYVYGGTSLTKGVDCSGFTMKVYAHYGYSLPHSSKLQASYGKKVSLSKLKTGDLLFFAEGDDDASIYHVALYIGNGMMIHAVNENVGIVISKLYGVSKAVRLKK